MTYAPAESTGATLDVISGATGATHAATGRVPLIMPAEQEYYWRFRWQNEERQSLLELRSGDSHTFDSEDPGDAARWLLDDE